MTYNPKWRKEDERRQEWLEKLYRQEGRHKKDHPKTGLYTGLAVRHGNMPWAVN